MNLEITCNIILLNPTIGVDFGLQKGSGSVYETIQKQRAAGNDLNFNCLVIIKGDKEKDATPKFSGPFVQGPATQKFIYIDIGTCAGQIDTIWNRRLKVPLTNITWKMIDEILAVNNCKLQTVVPGYGKDGGPNCATVKPFDGWKVVKVG